MGVGWVFWGFERLGGSVGMGGVGQAGSCGFPGLALESSAGVGLGYLWLLGLLLSTGALYIGHVQGQVGGGGGTGGGGAAQQWL